MTRISVSSHVQDASQNPIVLIDGDLEFIGYFFSRLLLQQNCRLVFVDDLVKKKIEKIDYIFSLAQINSEQIKHLISLAEKFGAKLLVAIPAGEKKERLVEKILKSKKIDWRIVILDHIYGPRMGFDQYQEMIQLIKVVKVRPLFIGDAVYGLVKAMFSVGTSKKTFSLNDKSGLDWQPKVNLQEGLKRTEEFFAGQRKPIVKSIKPEEKKPRPKRKPAFAQQKVLAVISFFILILVLFSPFLSLFFHAFLGTRALKVAQKAAVRLDSKEAIEFAGTAETHFQQANQRVIRLSPFFDFLSQEKTTARAHRAFDLGIKAARGVTYGSRVIKGGSELVKATMVSPSFGLVLGADTGQFNVEAPVGVEDMIAEVRDNLNGLYDQLSFIQAEVEADPDVLQLGRWLGIDDSITTSLKKLPALRESLVQLIQGASLTSELIGLHKKQVYLVLLQNNMELRPTGGFIGSYALLTFDKGQLADFEVQDVYTADGQLRGHVEPPDDLKKYLGEAGWYLRDSNWDPNFPTSAVRAAWFLEKETGRKVDGVLAINLILAQRLLGAVGDVVLPDYQETINAANVFERAEYHSEVNFFPGSTQKKDFLGSLTRSLFEKMKAADQRASFEIAKAVFQSLREKDVLIYLGEPGAMATVTSLGWDGAIKELGCHGNEERTLGCFVDYLMVVDSNVGVNKANYFVKRDLSHQVHIGPEGKVEGKVKVAYQNASQTDVFPAGRYKNYLRIYVPSGSHLQGIEIFDPLTGEKEVIDSERQEMKKAQGKEVFGVLVEVPIMEERLVEISYQLPGRVRVEEGVEYLALIQKQSGVFDEEYTFQLTPPKGITAISNQPKAMVSGGPIAFQSKFNQDLIFDIQLVK